MLIDYDTGNPLLQATKQHLSNNETVKTLCVFCFATRLDFLNFINDLFLINDTGSPQGNEKSVISKHACIHLKPHIYYIRKHPAHISIELVNLAPVIFPLLKKHTTSG